MAYHSKVEADSLLSLVTASDCVEYFGVASLVSEMNEVHVLDAISEEEIVEYLQDKGYNVEK